MKNLNILNIFFIVFSFVLTVLLSNKMVSYKASERYYYTVSVSNPEEFPIYISGIWFHTENGEFASSSFHKTEEIVNSFRSNWGEGEYSEAYEPELLPKSLFLEYVDYRTKNYYVDTIRLPKEKMTTIFKYARENNFLENLSSWNKKMGLKYHVGIANDGNIVFWLVGENYEKEFYRTQLQPKLFKNYVQATEQKIEDKNRYFKSLFNRLTDSTHLQIIKTTPINAQFKDSIPVYFNNLQR